MKIEIHQDQIILRAENSFEQDALDTLESRRIAKIEFEDNWNNTGGLRLISAKNSWET